MQTIWKFELQPRPQVQTLSIPERARPLTAAAQGDVPCVWFKVETGQPREDRTFEIYGTGHAMTPGVRRDYIGTALLACGEVYHIFERCKA